MITITLDNIIAYIQENTDLFPTSQVFVVDISDFNPSAEQEGFVNYVFRVYTEEKSVILKQARPYLKYFGKDFTLTPLRNQVEFQTMKLRGTIVPQYVPEIYFADLANNIFIMEDLSHLDVMRFQLNKGTYFPGFAQQISEYMAKTHFYTSELCLDGRTHKLLQAAFINPDMRSIMENAAFVRWGLVDLDSNTTNPTLLKLSNRVWSNDDVVLECYKMRNIFMKRGDCLIHGDLHTSNIFVGPEEMKVFDMEYTFMGPYAFDIGYLVANFVSQFSAHSFKLQIPEGAREEYCRYLLNTIREIYNWYLHFFNQCWENDVKDEYRALRGYRESVLEGFLPEVIGFAACANLIRIISLTSYPDYDVIEDERHRCNAWGLSIAIDQYLLAKREEIKSIDHLLDIILTVRERYLKNLS